MNDTTSGIGYVLPPTTAGYVQPTTVITRGYKTVSCGDHKNEPLSAPDETHKESKPVRSITIEFERMPGIPRRVVLAFWRGEMNPSILVPFMDGTFRFNAMAGCHPSDTFSWEIGMRLCVKRIGNPVLYRAFRRWMWLKKAAHECNKHTDCIECPFMDDDIHCDSDWMNGKSPAAKIASEFGRVKVRVT